MHRFSILCLTAGLLLIMGGGADAAEFKLTDGTVMSGEPISPNDKGVVIKSEDKFSSRIEWNKFSLESLKVFAANPKLKKFVELLIEPLPVTESEFVEQQKKARTAWPEIVLKNVEHPARPAPNARFTAGLATPIGFVSLLVFIAANLFAGYEIALYRNRPRILVCGASLVPVLGPLFFLCLPTVPKKKIADEAPKETREHALPSAVAAATAAEERAREIAAAPPVPEPSAPPPPPTTVYRRGEFTFNRRFFETKFGGFLRLVPGEAEKKLEMAFFTARGDFVGRRISKLLPEALQLAIHKESAFVEETIPYNDIHEVQVRPKDQSQT